MIPRPRHTRAVLDLLAEFPVGAIIGARQVGKTTLARMVSGAWTDPVHWFDLERPADLASLAEPELALSRLHGLIVIDEVQLAPWLFPLLRVLADRPEAPARFLVLGSAGPTLLQKSSESLAGRIAYHELGGFGIDEVGIDHLERLWLRGGFPRSFLASSDAASLRWRRQFLRTYLERDLPQLGVRIPSATLRRFWTMLAHHHAQILNSSELGRAFGVSHTTVRGYLDLLAATFVVWQLPAWYENLGKRQVKAPKFYITDTGLLHALLGLQTMRDLTGHPKVGASWEGFALQETIRARELERDDCYFWATHAGAEIDLVAVQGARRQGWEFKRTSAPRRTRSMASALDSLGLESIEVVYPGTRTFPLHERIEAVPIGQLASARSPS